MVLIPLKEVAVQYVVPLVLQTDMGAADGVQVLFPGSWRWPKGGPMPLQTDMVAADVVHMLWCSVGSHADQNWPIAGAGCCCWGTTGRYCPCVAMRLMRCRVLVAVQRWVVAAAGLLGCCWCIQLLL